MFFMRASGFSLRGLSLKCEAPFNGRAEKKGGPMAALNPLARLALEFCLRRPVGRGAVRIACLRKALEMLQDTLA